MPLVPKVAHPPLVKMQEERQKPIQVVDDPKEEGGMNMGFFAKDGLKDLLGNSLGGLHRPRLGYGNPCPLKKMSFCRYGIDNR